MTKEENNLPVRVTGFIYGTHIDYSTKEDLFILELFYDFHCLFKMYKVDYDAYKKGDYSIENNIDLTYYY